MKRSHMSNSKATYPSDQVVTSAHVINEFHYIFIFTMSIATKLNRVMVFETENLTTV